MEKSFNTISLTICFIGGILSKLFGKWDILLSTLCVLMVFDYITGILKGFFLKELDSKTGFWGIVKKFVMLIIVSTAYMLGNILDSSIPLREIVITFFISNEGLSILENSAVFIPIPEKLKESISQLRKTD